MFLWHTLLPRKYDWLVITFFLVYVSLISLLFTDTLLLSSPRQARLCWIESLVPGVYWSFQPFRNHDTEIQLGIVSALGSSIIWHTTVRVDLKKFHGFGCQWVFGTSESALLALIANTMHSTLIQARSWFSSWFYTLRSISSSCSGMSSSSARERWMDVIGTLPPLAWSLDFSK